MSSIPLGTKGWVYAMTTQSHGYIKIGVTTLHPEVRAFQLTNATAAPHPFKVLHCREVEDCNEAEATLHRLFDDRRVNEGREFFAISPDEAGIALDEIAGGEPIYACTDWHGPEVATPWAELFGSFPDDGAARTLTSNEQKACRQLASRLAPKGE